MQHIKIEEVARFSCTYQENIQRIAMALAQAGRFVQVEKDGGTYQVVVYEQKRGK